MKKLWMLVTVLIGCFSLSCAMVRVGKTVHFKDLATMPPFEATLEDVDVSHPLFVMTTADVWLRRSDTGKFLVLEISDYKGANKAFVESLERGQQYSFPSVLTNFPSAH